MKKFLGILILSFLVCNQSLAANSMSLPKDVAFGNKYFKSLAKNYKKYGMQVVDKKYDIL